ncbi:MAG: biotin transporter BioY [Clostridia bacterium]|nr:biotin transporter BioY [Clostridia bacterium]
MKLTTKEMVITALFAAIFCIMGPISIPIGPIPVSLTNFVIYISCYMLSTKNAVLSYIIYMLLGAVGLPVFSGFAGGIGKLAGPTGGYIVGFIFTAVISGIVINKFYNNKLISALGMLLGLIVVYAFGTAWFAFLNGDKTIYEILKLCVIPFIAVDIIKIAIAAIIGPIFKSKLKISAGIK